MKCCKNIGGVCLGVLASMALCLATPGRVLGQAQVVNDGRATEANNRVGSGGYNNAVNPPPSNSNYVSGNQIVTGNVTSGFGFRGPTRDGVNLGAGYTDPNAFRGILPGEGVDQFVADSAGVPSFAQPTTTPLYEGPRPFYGTSNTVVTPPGYVRAANNQSFVPSMTIPPSMMQDTRLNALMAASNSPIPQPGELLLPGPVDPTANTLFSASPMYGTRSWQLSGAQSQSPNLWWMQNSTTLGPMGPVKRARQSEVKSMQEELKNNLLPETAGNSATGPLNNASMLKPLTPSGNIGQSLEPTQMTPEQVTPTNLAPTAGNLSTEQSTRTYLSTSMLPAAARQSSQYGELQRRLNQFNSSAPKTDEEANREYVAALKTARANAAAGNDAARPPSAPGGAGSSVIPQSTPNAGGGANSAADLGPVQVGDLATGIQARGLADLVSRAEDLVRHQEYAKAIDAYDEALQVAPNNALIVIGRAQAELGGAYYRQAEADFRAAFKGDRAVLMGQFDLQKQLGDDRLQFVTSDLKQIASDSPDNATPVFLLACIAYNTHHADLAAIWLDLADKRSGGHDDVIPLLKKYWDFKSAANNDATPATQPDNENK